MRRKRNIKRSIAIRIRRVHANFPILWRKRADFSGENWGIREKTLIRMAARWALKKDKSKNIASIVRKLETDLQNRYSAEEKRVLFLVEHVSPRVNKMAKALYDAGYHVTLLHSSMAADHQENLKDARKYCGYYVDYESVAQLLYLIIDSRIPIIHYFVSWGDMSTAILLFQAREILPKIVVERYDILNGMYIQKQILFKQERYLMECADGVCCREYAGEYCKEELGFHLRRDPLLFWDYADQARIFEKKKDEELAICYAGGIITEKEESDGPCACFLELADICEQNKCHFHVYPSAWDEKRFDLFIQYEKKHKYFHLHKTIEHSKLYEELGQYDYGIMPVRKTYRDKAITQYYTKDKTTYAATNKYFDYISAGIPMIGAIPEKQTLDFEKMGMILRWTIEEFDFEEMRRRRKELHANLLENRAYWMIQNHISDLADYYKTVLE